MFHLDPLSSWLLIGLIFVLSWLLARIFASIGAPRVEDACPGTTAAPAEEALRSRSRDDELYDWAVHGL